MQQYISLITLGIADIARSRRFYGEGFGWKPVFQNEEITFYQVNGFVFGTWLTRLLEGDMQCKGLSQSGAFALAHNLALLAALPDDHQVLAQGMSLFEGLYATTSKKA